MHPARPPVQMWEISRYTCAFASCLSGDLPLKTTSLFFCVPLAVDFRRHITVPGPQLTIKKRPESKANEGLWKYRKLKWQLTCWQEGSARCGFQGVLGNAGVFMREALFIFTEASRIRLFTIEWCILFFAAFVEISPGDRFFKLFINHVFPIVAGAVLFMHNAVSFCSLKLPLWKRCVAFKYITPRVTHLRELWIDIKDVSAARFRLRFWYQR